MAAEGRDDLDRLLDSALSAYVDAPPRPGLEQRVLRHAREGRAPGRGIRARSWAWSIPVLAAVLAIWVRVPREPGPPPPPHLALTVPSRVSDQPTPRAPTGPAIHSHRHALPKRGVFPTPSPVSNEERALLLFAARHPDQMAAIAVNAARAAEPVRIEPLYIQPLEGGAN